MARRSRRSARRTFMRHFVMMQNNQTGKNVAAAFSPATLFASGETGAWYEPNVGSLQTSSGELTEAGPGDPVGFQLDQSQGAGFSGGAFTGLGSELVTNGGFDADTDWTKGTGTTISGGELNINIGSSIVVASQNIGSISEGTAYYFEADCTSYTSGSVVVGTKTGTTVAAFVINGVGSYSGVVVAGTANDGIRFLTQGSGFIGSIDNISVREIPGNHATQSTAAARPTLQATYNGTGALGSEFASQDIADHTAVASTLSDNGNGTWNLTDSDGSVGYTQNLMTGLTIGDVYFITSTVTNNTTSGNLNLQVGTSAGGNQVLELSLDADTDGTLSGVFTATATSHWIGFRSSAFVAGDGFDFTPISVKEVPEASRRYYLEFDGVDDGVDIGLNLNGSTWTSAMAYQPLARRFILVSDGDANAPYVGIGDGGSSNTTLVGAGATLNATYWDNSLSSSTTRGQMYTEAQASSTMLVDFSGTASWTPVRLGEFNGLGFTTPGDTYSFVLIDRSLTTEERAALQTYFEGKLP